jgi:hypothetical protein
MSRRPPQAPPPGNSNDKESEQEDVSSEAKQKVQKNIMTFFKKKPKKHGRGHPPKETTPPPPLAKKQKDEEAGKPAKKKNVGDAKKYINYCDPVVAAALKEAANYYYETGKLVGNLLKDFLGQNTKKKIPSRRINFMSGNVASYSRVLNKSDALKHIEDANMLSACISTISESRELAKDAAKEKKSQKQSQKKKKRLIIKQSLKRRRESCMRSLCGTCRSLWRLQVPSQRLSQKISY